MKVVVAAFNKEKALVGAFFLITTLGLGMDLRFKLWTQVECGAVWGPPPGCLQYHTGPAGSLETWNYADPSNIHTNNQAYTVCIRRERGSCGYAATPVDEQNRWGAADM